MRFKFSKIWCSPFWGLKSKSLVCLELGIFSSRISKSDDKVKGVREIIYRNWMWWVCHWVTAKRLLMYTMYISINKVSLPTQNVKSKLGYFFSTCMMSIGVTDDDYIYTIEGKLTLQITIWFFRFSLCCTNFKKGVK
jgi:hypothetical protein